MKKLLLFSIFFFISLASIGQGAVPYLRINGTNYYDNSTIDLDCGILDLNIIAMGSNQSGSIIYGTKCQTGWSYPSGWQLISEDGCEKTIRTNNIGEGNISVTYVIQCGSLCIVNATVTINFKRKIPPTPTISGSNPMVICSGQSIEASAGFIPFVNSFTWDAEGGVSVSPTGFSTANVSASSSGKIRLRANAIPSSGCPNSNWTEVNVHYGVPSITSPLQWLFDSGSNMWQCSNIVTPTLGNSYSWSLVFGSATLVPNINDCYVTTTSGATVSVTASNSCGTSSPVYYNIPAADTYMKVYPNPAKDLLMIQLKDVTDIDQLPNSIELYSKNSIEKVRTIFVKEYLRDNSLKEGNKIELSVSDLPRGIYFLHIIPNQKARQKVQIIQTRLE